MNTLLENIRASAILMKNLPSTLSGDALLISREEARRIGYELEACAEKMEQAARAASPKVQQGVLDYGYNELFWAIAAAVEKSEPDVPRKISVRAFQEKLLSASPKVQQGVEEWIENHQQAATASDVAPAIIFVDDLRALLSGMAIVPVEPTDEMVDYAERMDWSIPDSRAVVINIWQAMLAATKEKQL